MADSITIHFNKAADAEAKNGTEAMFDMNGKPIVMPGLFKRRVRAQMDSAMVQQRMMRKKAR